MGASPIPFVWLIVVLYAASLVVGGLINVIAWATIQTIRDRRARRRWDASLGLDFEIRPGRPGDPKSVWDRDLDD